MLSCIIWLLRYLHFLYFCTTLGGKTHTHNISAVVRLLVDLTSFLYPFLAASCDLQYNFSTVSHLLVCQLMVSWAPLTGRYVIRWLAPVKQMSFYFSGLRHLPVEKLTHFHCWRSSFCVVTRYSHRWMLLLIHNQIKCLCPLNLCCERGPWIPGPCLNTL